MAKLNILEQAIHQLYQTMMHIVMTLDECITTIPQLPVISTIHHVSPSPPASTCPCAIFMTVTPVPAHDTMFTNQHPLDEWQVPDTVPIGTLAHAIMEWSIQIPKSPDLGINPTPSAALWLLSFFLLSRTMAHHNSQNMPEPNAPSLLQHHCHLQPYVCWFLPLCPCLPVWALLPKDQIGFVHVLQCESLVFPLWQIKAESTINWLFKIFYTMAKYIICCSTFDSWSYKTCHLHKPKPSTIQAFQVTFN